MARTIAERLSASAAASFIGREPEIDVLRQALEADELPFVVAYIHGPGGIGKSSLLHAALRAAGPRCGSVVLDCREIEPTARGFLQALGAALGRDEADLGELAKSLASLGRKTAVALDTFENLGLIDTWLRQTFVPAMPETVLTIIASRQSPNPGWVTAPGWHGLFHEIKLSELPDDDAREMLESRGLAAAQAERARRFARGYPLALELAAAALRAQPDLKVTSGPPPAVLQQLTRAVVAGLPTDVTEAVEAASTVRRLTEPVLKALLHAPDIRDVYEQLRMLPFVDAMDEGLVLHDVVREACASELAARDPERHLTYRKRAWRFFTREAKAAAGRSLWQCTADLLYLVENPIVRDAFFPPGASDFAVESATPADAAGIREIAITTDTEESAHLLARWWEKHPETFHAVRGVDDHVAGFYILFEPHAVDHTLLADDPLTAAWLRHLEQSPVADHERVLLLRRWLARTTGEALSPVVAAAFLDTKRTYMELRPRLRRIYCTITDLAAYAPVLTPLGFVPIEDARVTLGGVVYHTAMLDFGAASVDGWLSTRIGAELGADLADEEAELPAGTVSILFADIADSTSLTEQLGDAAFRTRARDLEAALRAAIDAAGGRVVEGKLLGDGLLAVFTFAADAITCALGCRDAAHDTELRLHLGVHAGDVIRERDNVFGGAVNIAARIAAASGPGEILVSETVRSLARTSAGVAFEDRGEHTLKGVADVQRLFSVRKRSKT